MWEMQQLGRRAGALDIDLMSSQPGKQTNKLLSSLLGGCIRGVVILSFVLLVLLAPTGTISGIAYPRK